jgi:hypothetical protein
LDAAAKYKLKVLVPFGVPNVAVATLAAAIWIPH